MNMFIFEGKRSKESRDREIIRGVRVKCRNGIKGEWRDLPFKGEESFFP